MFEAEKSENIFPGFFGNHYNYPGRILEFSSQANDHVAWCHAQMLPQERQPKLSHPGF